MKSKHPLVKKMRKAGASTRAAMRVIAKLEADEWERERMKKALTSYGDDIGYLFCFISQPEGFSYWNNINKKMGY